MIVAHGGGATKQRADRSAAAAWDRDLGDSHVTATHVVRDRHALRSLCAALALAVLGSSGCAITWRIDEHTSEIHGNAAKVDQVARRTCEPRQVTNVTQLDYKPERTGSSVIDISRSATSCDSYGSCTRTDTRDVTPITITIPAQRRVRVRCT